jgi:hypothetical protein
MSNIQCISFLGSLKQQKSLLSQFWRLQVQNQGVGRAKLLLKALGENPFQAFLLPSSVTSNPWVSLACSCITTICFHCHLASFPVRLCPNFLLLIMTPCIRLWPILVQYGIITTWLYLQRPYFQIKLHLQILGGHEFGEDIIQYSAYSKVLKKSLTSVRVQVSRRAHAGGSGFYSSHQITVNMCIYQLPLDSAIN